MHNQTLGGRTGGIGRDAEMFMGDKVLDVTVVITGPCGAMRAGASRDAIVRIRARRKG